MSQLFQTLRQRRSVKNDTLFTSDGPDDNKGNFVLVIFDDQNFKLSFFSEKKEAADSLKDGETVSLVLPSMMQNPKVVELGQTLKDWVNDVLAPDRIIVKEFGQYFFLVK